MPDPVEFCRDRIDLAARGAVNDARFVLVPVEDLADLVEHRVPPLGAVNQIRAIERPDQDRSVAQRQLLNDVESNLLGRRGREGVDADVG